MLISPSYHFMLVFFFLFNDTATTEIYTLSLHDALPISTVSTGYFPLAVSGRASRHRYRRDRKSTRLNSSHSSSSYAGFCWKKKKISARGGQSCRVKATSWRMSGGSRLR